VPNPANSQSYNRYSYGYNNPIRYVDPSGHSACEGSRWDDGPQCVNDPRGYELRGKIYSDQCRATDCVGIQDGAELVASLLVEPIDYLITARDCLEGDCWRGHTICLR
jgi:hypothetical protein